MFSKLHKLKLLVPVISDLLLYGQNGFYLDSNLLIQELCSI